jgi:hypothetical protein
VTEFVAVFSRRRQPAKRYVEPPELRAGVVILATPAAWRVAGLNAGNGSVPTLPSGSSELAGVQLAAAFRDSWSRARDGAAAATSIVEWVRSIDARAGRDLVEMWRDFFVGGGQVFKVWARPGEGIMAQRFVWFWPLAGQEPVRPSLKQADEVEALAASRWRDLIDDRPAWNAAPEWETTATWMSDRARVDQRASAWWIADPQGRPTLAVDETDVLAEVRGWWAGGGSAFGSAIVERYALPAPTGEGIWYGWLRWDPIGSPREDGLATVLGLRRATDGLEVLWWDIGADGQPGRPWRARPRNGGAVSIDLVEALCVSVAATERRWPNVDWVEAV